MKKLNRVAVHKYNSKKTSNGETYVAERAILEQFQGIKIPDNKATIGDVVRIVDRKQVVSGLGSNFMVIRSTMLGIVADIVSGKGEDAQAEFVYLYLFYEHNGQMLTCTHGRGEAELPIRFRTIPDNIYKVMSGATGDILDKIPKA